MPKNGWIFAVVIALGVCAVGWFTLAPRFNGNTSSQATSTVVATSAGDTATREPARPQPRPIEGAQVALASGDNLAAGQALANQLETARNLRAVFDEYKDSASPIARNIAYRAWSACHPTFISPQGQPVSLDHVLKTLSDSGIDSAARRAAYRALYQRCEGFFNMSREAAVLNTQVQQEKWERGESAAPGEQAMQILNAGDEAKAFEIARAAAASKDAYAIASLQEFVYLSLRLQRDAGALPGNARVDIRSLAYSLAACRLGLECGAESLTALRLCANSGQCEGGVADRLLQSLPNANDREAANAETARVIAATQAEQFDTLGFAKKN